MLISAHIVPGGRNAKSPYLLRSGVKGTMSGLSPRLKRMRYGPHVTLPFTALRLLHINSGDAIMLANLYLRKYDVDMNALEYISKLEAAGFTRYRIAKLTGISQATLSRICAGLTKDPRQSKTLALKDAYEKYVRAARAAKAA